MYQGVVAMPPLGARWTKNVLSRPRGEGSLFLGRDWPQGSANLDTSSSGNIEEVPSVVQL